MYSQKPILHARQKAYRDGDLRTLSIDVTGHCNMKCPQCYAAPFRETSDVDLDLLCAAIKEAHGLGVFHFVMQGGEPITRKDRLDAILKACVPPESYLNVVSNGWDMNLDNIQWLKERGVDKIAFSLDSGLPSEHDANRGEGSFDRTITAIDNTLKAGLLSSVSMVATRTNFDTESFWAVYFLCLRKRIRLDIQIAEPIGNWDGKTDMLLTKEQSQRIRYFRYFSPILANGQKMVNRDLFMPDDSSRCPAVSRFMAISADGHILPCNFIQASLGKVGEVTIAEARARLLKSKLFSQVHDLCLCGEDHDFIEQFITPYVGVKKPLDAVKLFKL